MAFNIVTNNQQEANTEKTQVDYAAMNKYMIETVDAKSPEVVVGVVSGIIDLGIQPQKDAEYVFDGTEEDERLEISKNPRVTFETRENFYSDGKWVKNVRVKIVPMKEQQSIALMIDFPKIIVDKGQFFGNPNPAPLRMLLGGEFSLGKGQPIVVAKPFPLSVRKNDKTNNEWSMAHNSTLYQMAVGAKIIEKGKPFLPQDVDKLLGKAFQFEILVSENEKGYYTEKCSFKAALGRDQSAGDYDTSLLHIVQFTTQNDEKALKQLRASVKNTIRRASNYNGSALQAQLDGSNSAQNAQGEEKPREQGKGISNAPQPSQDAFDDFDDDVMF